jgi:hypothetical protein
MARDSLQLFGDLFWRQYKVNRTRLPAAISGALCRSSVFSVIHIC